jgi:hypothetical protein
VLSRQLPIADEHLKLLHEYVHAYVNKARVNSSIVDTRKMVSDLNRRVNMSNLSELSALRENVELQIKNICDTKAQLNDERRHVLTNAYDSVIDERKGSLTTRLAADCEGMDNFREFKCDDDLLSDELERLLAYLNEINEKMSWLKVDKDFLDKERLRSSVSVRKSAEFDVQHKEILSAIRKFNSHKEIMFKDFEKIFRLIKDFKMKVIFWRGLRLLFFVKEIFFLVGKAKIFREKSARK